MLDSLGTAIDSAGIRHSLAFFLSFAQSFFRGADRRALEEVWSYVALRSRTRSAGRFRLLSAALRLAPRHPRLRARYPREEEVAAALDLWIASSTTCTATDLERAMRDRSYPEALIEAALWSLDVDARLAVLPPPKAFNGVAEALLSLTGKARIVVAGEGRAADIERDWRRAGLLGSLASLGELVFVGEDGGSLSEIALAAGYGGGSILMIGNSPVDLEAARRAGVAFYPVHPGAESECWSHFVKSVFTSFLRDGKIAADSARFLSCFSSSPSWLEVQRGKRPTT